MRYICTILRGHHCLKELGVDTKTLYRKKYEELVAKWRNIPGANLEAVKEGALMRLPYRNPKLKVNPTRFAAQS